MYSIDIMNITNILSILEFLGITKETFFPQFIVGTFIYIGVTRSVNTSLRESLNRIELRLSNIELRLDHIEGYLQEMSLSMVEMQTVMKMKFQDITFEHKIKPYKKLSKAQYTQI